MPTAVHLVLLALLILGTAMWLGGMVAVTMLSVITKSALEPADRTALFKRFGKSYFPIFGVALVVAIGAGLVMLIDRGFDALAWSIVILVVIILVALGFGVVQARSMGRLRARGAELHGADGSQSGGHDDPPPTDDDATGGEWAALQTSIASGARSAAILRGMLGLLSAAVFVLAICTAA